MADKVKVLSTPKANRKKDIKPTPKLSCSLLGPNLVHKLLLCGDVEGKFNKLFSKVENINKKAGPFDLLLCVGNFFGINNTEFEPYKNGFKKVPIPTYILGSNKEDHNDLFSEDEPEICNNITYLGKRGLFTSSTGLKIAYLSGIPGDSNEKKHFYTSEDAIRLRDICYRGNPNFRGVDILLTSNWPEGIVSDKKIKLDVNAVSAHPSWIALNLMPRYHISGLEGVFYECPPYRNYSGGDLGSVTRFLGLARVDNPKKEKWIYALNVTPLEKIKISELLQKTTDEINCPYNLNELEVKVLNKKRKVSESQQYFFDMNASMEDGKKKHGKKQKVIFDQSKCWFCLASPTVEKHLVITVGNAVYLAFAKGGMVDEHFLICPVEHHQCSIGLSDDVLEEIEKFKDAIRKFYARNNKVAVFFERNFKTSHMQIQSVPIPKNAAKELKDIFQEEASGNGFELGELESHNRLDQVIPKGVPYFTVELPNGAVLQTRVHANKGFPLNFGRDVLAMGPILNLPDRADWKDCKMSEEEEVDLVRRIRTDFEPYDISIDD